MAEINLKALLTFRNDTAENWESYGTKVLAKGEPAIVWVDGVPRLKFGDGTTEFSSLPFFTTSTTDSVEKVVITGTGNAIANAAFSENTLTLTKGNFLTEHQDISGKVDKINIEAKTIGLYKVAYNAQGQITSSATVTKSDIAGLGIPSENTTYVFEEGTVNGAFSVTPSNSEEAQSVKIHGLGSAAYTDSSAYATAAQGTLAQNAMPKSGGTFTGAVSGIAPTADTNLTTKKYVDDTIAAQVAALFKFKGTKDTAADLPESNNTIGDVWHVKENHAEYVWVTVDGASEPSWELLGTSINLDPYALKTDLKTLTLSDGKNSIPYSPLTAKSVTFAGSGSTTVSISGETITISSTDNDTKVSNVANSAGKVFTGISNGTTVSTTNVGALVLTGFTSSTDTTGTILATDTITSALNKLYNLANSKTSNTGTVTSIEVGGGLTGGTITTTGTISHGTKPSSGTALEAGAGSGLTFLTEVSIDTYGHIASAKKATVSAAGLGALTSITAGAGISVTGSGVSRQIAINTNDTYVLNGGSAAD